MSSSKLTLYDIPPEVLLDNIFPLLSYSDILRLTCVSKYFSDICSDETLWKRKLGDDFNFDPSGTARRTGWKFIYRGLANPRVFVWGERGNGRLGLRRFPECSIKHRGVPFPTQLYIPKTHIIKLLAGGMSFHALDTKGNVHVWGTLDGSDYALHDDGYYQKGKPAPMPVKLQLPNPVRSISCGRLHSMALDNKNNIWNFVNWGRPFRLTSHLLSLDGAEPLQIECGWAFSSALLKNGDVVVWWPSTGTLAEVVRQKNSEIDNEGTGKAHALNGVIECYTWTTNTDPVLLPPLPQLPDIAGLGEDNRPHLIQIAALDAHIVGLTNQGHVVKFGGLEHESTARTTGWQYLPEFSEVSRVRDLPAFSESTEDTISRIEAPETMIITHISANFLHFFAYSTGDSSIVLQGDVNTTPETKPYIIPGLQNKNIISVVVGDYHNAALTADGKLYAWGAFSNGALGLGDPASLPIGAPGGFKDQSQRGREGWATPPDVSVPTQVRFDHGRKKPKERFCFSVTAAGWHTGALVIDLEPDENEEDDEVQNLEPEPGPRPHTAPDRSRWQGPPLIPLRGMFPPGGFAGLGGRGIGRGQDS